MASISPTRLLRLQLRVLLLEGIRDVLEKDQPQDDVLVLRGIHAAPQGIRHLPELRFIAHSGGRIGLRFLAPCHSVPFLSIRL